MCVLFGMSYETIAEMKCNRIKNVCSAIFRSLGSSLLPTTRLSDNFSKMVWHRPITQRTISLFKMVFCVVLFFGVWLGNEVKAHYSFSVMISGIK